MGKAAAAEGRQAMRNRPAIVFPCADSSCHTGSFRQRQKTRKSVYHVLGTKCIPCAGLDRESSRHFFAFVLDAPRSAIPQEMSARMPTQQARLPAPLPDAREKGVPEFGEGNRGGFGAFDDGCAVACERAHGKRHGDAVVAVGSELSGVELLAAGDRHSVRSEERRVGKEGG